MIVFSMLTVTGDVLLRVFRMSLWWSFEVTEFILVYIPFLTLPWLVRRRGHIVIDVLTSRLSDTAGKRLEIVTSLIAAAISLNLVYWGAFATWSAYERGITSSGMVEYPRWALLCVIPLGFALAAFEFGRLVYEDFSQAR